MTQEVLEQNAQIALRKEKLKAHRKVNGSNAYPNDFKPTVTSLALHEKYGALDKQALEKVPDTFKLAGRIMLQRHMGKASFVKLKDTKGAIQLYLKASELESSQYESYQSWDLGDIIGVEGRLFKTNTGELSIRAFKICLITKSLRPLPDKWHGLADQEKRYRQRYVDLIVNDKTRKTFETRIKIIEALRAFLVRHDFLEVETPMMQVLPGGAAAKPFVTHHNSLDMDLYLRIAPELYLKRLLVGGMERVFEINRNFRNEGISTEHNPEFTMVEFYQAYCDYTELMDLTELMLREIAQKVLGRLEIEYQGRHYDLAQPFKRFTLQEAILQFNPHFKKEDLQDKGALIQKLNSLKARVESSWGIGKLQLELFEKTVEPHLIDPTFITEYPTEVSPLARRNFSNPQVTDRFEFFISGREIANAFSELNDPEDQAQRFQSQVQARAGGDEEAMPYDTDYITALEYGMPPAAGEGIGIDRLVMFFTDASSIREVILFPHMRFELPTKP